MSLTKKENSFIKKLVEENSISLYSIDEESPLTVGNGDIAYTFDVTGFQSLADEYQKIPLNTMSQWGWHCSPPFFTEENLQKNEYSSRGKRVYYAAYPQKNEESIFNSLRENPHKFNLFRFGLTNIKKSDISSIYQKLNIYKGIAESSYILQGKKVEVKTCCSPSSDTLSFDAKGIQNNFCFKFSYPGSNSVGWGNGYFKLEVEKSSITYIADNTSFRITIFSNTSFTLYKSTQSECILHFDDETFSFTLSVEPISLYGDYSYIKENTKAIDTGFMNHFTECENWWNSYWNASKIFAPEKEITRRCILSQYLLVSQCAGSLPPQETGLTMNSWYGRFHLEMYPLHLVWLAEYGHPELLEKSFRWFLSIQDKAEKYAKENGYEGMRWPKMSSYLGDNSPSSIAVFLLWQQPHVIYIAEELYKHSSDKERILNTYWPLVKGTADFMVSFAPDGRLVSPLIPVQETYIPENTNDPVFEIEYWKWGLDTAIIWNKRLGKDDDKLWKKVSSIMIAPSTIDGRISPVSGKSIEDCPLTDHPFALFSVSWLGAKSRIGHSEIKATLSFIESHWDWSTVWGWDYPLLALAYKAIGKETEAKEMLVRESTGNNASKIGHFEQNQNIYLPLYLPANGAFLFALPRIFENEEI